jgi:hypothetical protein
LEDAEDELSIATYYSGVTFSDAISKTINNLQSINDISAE